MLKLALTDLYKALILVNYSNQGWKALRLQLEKQMQLRAVLARRLICLGKLCLSLKPEWQVGHRPRNLREAPGAPPGSVWSLHLRRWCRICGEHSFSSWLRGPRALSLPLCRSPSFSPQPKPAPFATPQQRTPALPWWSQLRLGVTGPHWGFRADVTLVSSIT